MSLEIHYDQLQNSIDTFNAACLALEDAQGVGVAYVAEGRDALSDVHEVALGELGRLFEVAGGDFARVRSSAQVIFDGFKAADSAGG